MKTVVIRARKEASLNFLADYIFKDQGDFPDRASTFKMIVGSGTAAGSGDKPVVEIRIKFDNPTEQDLKVLAEIICKAEARADEVQVTVS